MDIENQGALTPELPRQCPLIIWLFFFVYNHVKGDIQDNEGHSLEIPFLFGVKHNIQLKSVD